MWNLLIFVCFCVLCLWIGLQKYVNSITSGKSTTIHFLCGSKMEMDAKTGHIAPVEVKNADMNEIKTDFKVLESVTRYICGVPLKLLDHKITARPPSKDSYVYLCDSPGFDDSGGAEIDVANGLGIVKALAQTNSVKIVLVISIGDLEKRLEGVKKLSYTLAQIFPSFIDHLDCINVIFTKMGNCTAGQIRAKFEQSLQEVDKSDENAYHCMHFYIMKNMFC